MDPIPSHHSHEPCGAPSPSRIGIGTQQNLIQIWLLWLRWPYSEPVLLSHTVGHWRVWPTPTSRAPISIQLRDGYGSVGRVYKRRLWRISVISSWRCNVWLGLSWCSLQLHLFPAAQRILISGVVEIRSPPKSGQVCHRIAGGRLQRMSHTPDPVHHFGGSWLLRYGWWVSIDWWCWSHHPLQTTTLTTYWIGRLRSPPNWSWMNQPGWWWHRLAKIILMVCASPRIWLVYCTQGWLPRHNYIWSFIIILLVLSKVNHSLVVLARAIILVLNGIWDG